MSFQPPAADTAALAAGETPKARKPKEPMMDFFSLVAVHLSAKNQPTFDPKEYDLAMRQADERRERWLERLAWIKQMRGMLRRNLEPQCPQTRTIGNLKAISRD